MQARQSLLINSVVLACLIFIGFKTQAQEKNDSIRNVVLVGCTPGDSLIKSLLGIHPIAKVDFIRWNLRLNQRDSFVLTIAYGVAQANTQEFKTGGEIRSFNGEYISYRNSDANMRGDIYYLKGRSPIGVKLNMIKLNDNLYHLLTRDNQLIVGNGNWSYTLNRKDPVPEASSVVPSLKAPSTLLLNASRQVIYEGRTPCLEISKAYQLSITPDCIKIKWKLTLNRDPITLTPTTYQLRRSNNRMHEIKGNWTIIKGIPSNSNAVIFRLDPDIPEKSFSLLVGDQNVLFMMDRDNQLLTGNSEFSYTLNKRSGKNEKK